jgi:hypothetical protein
MKMLNKKVEKKTRISKKVSKKIKNKKKVTKKDKINKAKKGSKKMIEDMKIKNNI